MLIDLNCTIVCIVLCKQGRCRGEKFENAAGYRGVLEWYIRRHSFCGVRQAEPRPVSRIAIFEGGTRRSPWQHFEFFSPFCTFPSWNIGFLFYNKSKCHGDCWVKIPHAFSLDAETKMNLVCAIKLSIILSCVWAAKNCQLYCATRLAQYNWPWRGRIKQLFLSGCVTRRWVAFSM